MRVLPTADGGSPDIEPALARVRAGEVDAFDAVVRAYALPLRAWIAGRCPPDCEPDEIAQAAFVAAFRNLHRYRPGSDFPAWLWAVARAQLMGALTDARRRRERERRHLPGLVEAALLRRADAGPLGDEARLAALRQCRDELPAAQRELLAERYERERAIEDIATGLGRSAVAVRKSLHLLRRRLAECVSRRLAGEAAHG